MLSLPLGALPPSCTGMNISPYALPAAVVMQLLWLPCDWGPACAATGSVAADSRDVETCTGCVLDLLLAAGRLWGEGLLMPGRGPGLPATAPATRRQHHCCTSIIGLADTVLLHVVCRVPAHSCGWQQNASSTLVVCKLDQQGAVKSVSAVH